jgi:hypothetical protein
VARVGYGSTFGFFIALVTLIVGGLFIYRSVAVVMRLRAEPPPEFIEVNPTWSAKQQEAEARLGRAYWDCARNLSRTTFRFGVRLPDNPPDVFSVDAKAYPSIVEPAPAARTRYWRNLQKVWTHPAAWEKTYEWHTSWFFQGTNY